PRRHARGDAHAGASRAPDDSPRPARSAGAAVTAVELFGTTFQNPVLLAAGTAGFGRELDHVLDLDRLGGIITKAVTPEPRQGHPALRVAEFRGGMLNAVGLANPGVERVAEHEIGRASCREKVEQCGGSGGLKRKNRKKRSITRSTARRRNNS